MKLNLEINAVDGLRAITELARLAPHYPDAVAGFIKSSRTEGELLEVRFDDDWNRDSVAVLLKPTPILQRFLDTLRLSERERAAQNKG